MLRVILVFALIAVGAAYSLRSAYYALLFYLWMAYFRPEFWIWSDVLMGSRLSLAVGVYLVLSTLFREGRFNIGWPGVLMGILCVHAMMSTLISPALNFSWPDWTDFAKSIVVTWMIIILVDSYEKLRLALIVICLSLGLEGAKQGWAYLAFLGSDINQNSIAFLGDNNGVAVGMLMLTSIFLALAQTSPRIWVRNLFRFLGIGTAFRALTTYSRGGLLAFGAMCSVYWLRSTRKFRTLILIVALAFGLLAMLPAAYWERMQTITFATAPTEDMEASSAGRLYFWGLAWQMGLDHPWFGVGHNAYPEFYDSYDTSAGQFGNKRAVHSSWFGTLADLGFVGLALLIAIMFGALRRCGRARTLALGRQDRDFAILAGAVQTALITFAVGATFLSFQYVEMLWHFVGLSVALERIAVSRASLKPAIVPSPFTVPAVAMTRVPAR